MKITKQRLKEIIREELSAERWATVPQVQRYAADAGVRLSYGDAKTLAAKTPAERGALARLQRAFKDDKWHGMMDEGYRADMTMPALSDDDFEPDLPEWEGEPFSAYDLDTENEKGRLAAAKALGVDPEDPSLWQKILAAVEKANLFPRAEQ